MSLIQLIHSKCLKLIPSRDMPLIPHEHTYNLGSSLLLTFRDNEIINSQKIKDINGCSRYLNFPDINYFFYNIDIDSPFAENIYWDIAHILSVGKTIAVWNDFQIESFLQKPYFKNNFKLISHNEKKYVFQKISPLPVELELGLDRWTFGIPTGHGDSTILNAVISRILELNIQEKEIILCGKPGNNFKFFDKVKIIGEHIPAPPIRIATKKNYIVEHAKYENVCILHDRVYLPSDFFEAMLKFGDLYPFVGLQSLLFEDYYNAIPKRYSDYGCTDFFYKMQFFSGINRQLENEIPDYSSNVISPSNFPRIMFKGRFIYANVLSKKGDSVLTGSLNIFKKCLWKFCQQNNSLFWEEFEDIEHGLRLAKCGIPLRINPFSFAQTISYRAGMISKGIGFQDPSGSDKEILTKMTLLPLARKPLYKITREQYLELVVSFIKKYTKLNPDYFLRKFWSKKNINSLDTTKIYLEIMLACNLRKNRKSFIEFLEDYEKMINLESLTYNRKYNLIKGLKESKADLKVELLKGLFFYHRLQLRLRGNLFKIDDNDYFVKKRFLLLLGTFISSIWLLYHNGRYIFHPEGFLGIFRSIMRSSPFIKNIR